MKRKKLRRLVGVDFPILSGDAVFVPGGGLDRIA